MTTDPSIYYNQRLEELSHEIKIHKKRDRYFFGVRLAFFFLFIAILVIASINKSYTLLYLLIPSSLIFILSVRYDLKNDKRLKDLHKRLQLNLNEIEYLSHNYFSQPTGNEYLNLNNQLAQDFNLFGEGSLFQYLNRCSTKMGAKALAMSLVTPNFEEEDIRQKQQAIKELSENRIFNENFRAIGASVKEKKDEIVKLRLWLNSESNIVSWQQYLAIIYPTTTIVATILGVMGVFSFATLTALLVIGLIFNGINAKRVRSEYTQVDKSSKIIGHYIHLLKLIENENFQSQKLSSLKLNLSKNNFSASGEIKKLFSLTSTFDNCYSMPFLALINPLFQFELITLLQLHNWKRKNGVASNEWLTTITHFDELLSFATYAFNNQQHTCLPTPINSPFTIDATQIGHPLIAPQSRVLNSFNMKSNPSVLIVTGANMAGKSTFIRTIASNLILAMNGAPVVATKMNFSPVEILSSIKIQDSQKDNKSYFYAELVGMKNIIERVKTNPKSIVFLDEMLRGTNSNDKQKGSFGFIENLISLNANVIVATHDLAIGELEDSYSGVVKNRCFEVELINNELHFDYILKKGVSQKLNASFLMKEMGIIK